MWVALAEHRLTEFCHDCGVYSCINGPEELAENEYYDEVVVDLRLGDDDVRMRYRKS